jgi:ribonuclease-3
MTDTFKKNTTRNQSNKTAIHQSSGNSNYNSIRGSYQNNDEEIQLFPEEIRDRILNEKNIPITEDFVNSIFDRIGFDHKVKNLEMFQLSMIHSSYLEENVSNPKTIKLLKDIYPIDHHMRKKCMPLQKRSYERLEYLGDSIIRHAIGKYLFKRYPDEEEGFLTTNRSKMENKFALSDLARKLGIQNYAVIAKNIELANGRSSYVTLTEDIFEAFIGALNLEIDENRTVDFLWLIIEKELDVPETIRTQNNYKDKLMQHFHKIDIVKHDLRYEDDEIETDDGKKRFRTIVSDKDTLIKLGVGTGRSKKSSQQRAAKDALIKLGLLGNDIEEEEYFDTTIVGNVTEELDKVRSHLVESEMSKDKIDNKNSK